MTSPPLPRFAEFIGRWRAEQRRRFLRPLFIGLSVILLVLLLVLALMPVSTDYLVGLVGLVFFGWLSAAMIWGLVSRRRPSPVTLAKRVDAVLGLPDDLLSLSELPAPEDAWRQAVWHAARDRVANLDLPKAWPLRVPRWTLASGVTAVLLTLVIFGWSWQKWNAETLRLAALAAAQEQRVAAAEELLQDWQEFAQETDDPELKKLFLEAAQLKEALQQSDPRAAMLEMNRIEERLQKMETAIANESLAPQAAKLAEALESFEGMGALSAAIRNQNFETAAREAEKLAAALKKDPQGKTALRREAAVAEMLATESQAAANRGNSSLSEALQQLSNAAKSGKGSANNSELAPPTDSLKSQLSQEAARKSRGRAAAMGKQQMDALRDRLQGQDPKDSPFPSLCKSCLGQKPGGKNAGAGAAGDPKGDPTELADAQVQETASGAVGEGESETRTTSAASGAATAAGGTKPANFSDYAELSQQAVADENLPLAHRRVIRTYFERIRPLAETSKP